MSDLRDELDRIVRTNVPCTCIDAYRERDLDDPQCAWHSGGGQYVTEDLLPVVEALIAEAVAAPEVDA